MEKRFVLKWPEEMRKAVDDAAHDIGISMAEWVRKAVQEALKRISPK